MAYSMAAISDAELAAYQADKPALLAGSYWRLVGGGTAYWSTSQASTSDAADALGPSTYLYDAHQHLRSYTDVAATTTWIKANLSAAPITLDTVALLYCSLFDVTSITIYVADNAALSTNVWSTVVTHNLVENVSTNNIALQGKTRVVLTNLFDSGTPQRFTSVAYLGIKIVTTSSVQPLVGELLLGNRVQLYNAPEIPWASWSYESDVARSTSVSGVETVYTHRLGARHVEAVIRSHTTARTSALETMFGSSIRWGADPWLWIDTPWTSPHAAPWLRLDDPRMASPYLGPFEREWAISATEIGPTFALAGG